MSTRVLVKSSTCFLISLSSSSSFSPSPSQPPPLLHQDIMGLPLKAPLTSYDTIYTLPMLTIKYDKGQRSCRISISNVISITLASNV